LGYSGSTEACVDQEAVTTARPTFSFPECKRETV